MTLARNETPQPGAMVKLNPATIVELAEGSEVLQSDIRLPFLSLLQANSTKLPPGGQPGQFYSVATGEVLASLAVVLVRSKLQRRMFEPGKPYDSERTPWCWSTFGTVPDEGAALEGRECARCEHVKVDPVYSLVVVRVDDNGDAAGTYMMRLGRGGAGVIGVLAAAARKLIVEVTSERVTTRKGTFYAWRARPLGPMHQALAADVDVVWQQLRGVTVPVWTPEDEGEVPAADADGVMVSTAGPAYQAPKAPVPPAHEIAQRPVASVRSEPNPLAVETPGGRKKCSAHGVWLARNAQAEWGHYQGGVWCAVQVGGIMPAAPSASPAPVVTAPPLWEGGAPPF